MVRKALTYLVLALAAVAVVGSVAYMVFDSSRSHARVSGLERKTSRSLSALERAKAALREKIREEVRKEDAKAVKKGTKTVAARKEKSKKFRKAAQRFVLGRSDGLSLPASYWEACQMPREDPTDEDQEIIDLAGESASEEDLDTAAEVAEAAKKSADPRARLAAVEMLSALGKVGMADLSEFLTDPHPEVANLAADRYELEVQNVVNDADRTELVKIGLLAISDTDMLRSMVGTLQMTSDELLIIQTVADVMREGSRAQREAVKEAYESTTGEPWTNEAAAEKWLQENYEPPPQEEPEEESEPEVQDDSEEGSSEEDGAEEGSSEEYEEEAAD